MPTLHVHHLFELAERPAGKSHLGEIVRRLVFAAVAKRQPTMHFLSGETNNYAGWDGWVQVEMDVDRHSAVHRSVWELSTDRDIPGKIRRDYKSAQVKALPNGWIASQTIYVAATLRSLTPTATAKIKRDLLRDFGSRWAGIVLLSADDFVQWVEKFPAVEDWAAIEFKAGQSRFGRSLEHAWLAWSQQTVPNVTDRLTLVDRDITPLQAALRFDAEKTASLQCDSTDEAVALIYCAVKQLPEQDARMVLANALVLTDERAADQLVDQPVAADSMPLVVLVPPATTQSQRLVQAGYRVIHAFGRKEDAPSVLSFERASIESFAKMLAESMAVPREEAELQARACGCSVAVWHIRNLFNRPLQPPLPEWADPSHADVIVPAVFMGAWHELSSPDADVISKLSGMDPATFAAHLPAFASCSTPLLEFIGADRFIIAPTAAFEFIVRNITRLHIGRLETVCKEVFSRVSSDVSARWEGRPSEMRIRNRHAELSDSLLDGLAETLLRIAVLGAPLQKWGALTGHATPQAFVDGLVRGLPGLSTDPRVAASLNNQLPHLIEAAPAPFLDALESLIQGDSPDLRTWLADESGVFGRSFHTGVLWGLEALAWSADHLPRVAEVLARLAAIDPGGQLSNRPFNSLCEIFLAWHPGTAASPSERADVLGDLLAKYPVIGWRLTVELLPGKRRTAHKTRRPTWRDLGQIDRRSMMRSEVVSAYELYVDLALDHIDQSFARLVDLIDAYPHLSPPHRSTLEQVLVATAGTSAPPSEVERLWRRLHKLIAHHRAFSYTEWALPTEVVDRLEQVALRFVTEDPVLQVRWLFDEQFPQTGHREEDFEGRQRDLDRRRQEAVAFILQKADWAGIARLVQTATYSYIVGNVVADLATDNTALLEAMNTWQAGASPNEMMALRSASSIRANREGPTWTDALLSFAVGHNWSDQAIATALLDYPDSRETYDLVNGLQPEIRNAYWQRRFPFIRLPDDDDESFVVAVQGFVEHKRAYELIDQNWAHLRRLGYRTLIELLDALILELVVLETPRHSGTIGHDIQQVFNWLRSQPDADSTEIARREYALLPFLTSYGDRQPSLSLHQILRSDPSFFVDVLCDLYRAASDEHQPEGQALHDAELRAHAAFDLLESWRAPPGMRIEEVDEDALNAWVDAARTLLRERDRAEVGDQQIGKVLYHLPADQGDQAWPHAALRRLLQRLKSDQLERGISIENYNSRGVTSRAMYEGGQQERALEAAWRGYAEVVGTKWSRARKLCLKIADGWRREADAMDLSAKRDRARWSR